jgi:hypothetical protein
MPDKKEKPEKGLTDEQLIAKYGHLKMDFTKKLSKALKNWPQVKS